MSILIKTPEQAMDALSAVYNFLCDNHALKPQDAPEPHHSAPRAPRPQERHVENRQTQTRREYSQTDLQDDYSNQAASAPTPEARKRNQWLPTWTVGFGQYKGRTLHTIARDYGPEALMPYRQRGLDQWKYPRPGDNQDTYREINRTMVAFIDEILRSYDFPIPRQEARPPKRNGGGRGGRGSGSNGGAYRNSHSSNAPSDNYRAPRQGYSSSEMLTENQERAIWASAIAVYGNKAVAEDEITAMLHGQEVCTLRKREASQLIDRLNQMKDEV